MIFPFLLLWVKGIQTACHLLCIIFLRNSIALLQDGFLFMLPGWFSLITAKKKKTPKPWVFSYILFVLDQSHKEERVEHTAGEAVLHQWPAEASLKFYEVRGYPSGSTGINLLLFNCPLSYSSRRAVVCWFVFLWLPLYLPFPPSSSWGLLSFLVPCKLVVCSPDVWGPLCPLPSPSSHCCWQFCKDQKEFYTFAREGYFKYYFSITAILLPDCWMVLHCAGKVSRAGCAVPG